MGTISFDAQNNDKDLQKRTYLMRVTIEVYDGVDAKTRRYATPAEHFQQVFTASNDREVQVLQAHCWHVCGVAVYNELHGDKKDTEG